nr:TonB-dependent receptor plug domain-containing protein [Sphingomonas sp.]
MAEAAPEATAPTPAGKVGSPGDPPRVPDSQEIVVTGIRQSLQRAAEIKKDAVQVVDAVIAQDISKFPNPTVSSALQRVPGIQVQNANNNELSGVRIRGLTDILTTVDGREVFTTTGRNFNLQDMPADALARVDVYKSQTAGLIEGRVARAIDLKLNKPFNFRKPTVVMTARSNYGLTEKKVNPQFGVLATDKRDTAMGEIGALVGASMSQTTSLRPATSLTDERNSAASPLQTQGCFIHNVLQPLGNTIYVMQPYCIDDDDLNRVYEVIEEALEQFSYA